jgi:hypothetical protein
MHLFLDRSNNVSAMKFLKILFWEYIQNLPVLVGFAWAMRFWQKGNSIFAITCLFIGGATGAILIAVTESKKQAGYREPTAVLLVNIFGITILMFIVLVYLLAPWSSWWTDIMIGIVLGIGLAVVQSQAARKKINIAHSIALGIASPLILVCFRWLADAGWSIWLNIFLMSLLATLVISTVDYAPDEIKASKERSKQE